MSGSYLMHYKGQSWAQVYNYNVKVVKRDSPSHTGYTFIFADLTNSQGMDQAPNIRAFQWYCYYLKYSMSFNLDCTIPPSQL